MQKQKSQNQQSSGQNAKGKQVGKQGKKNVIPSCIDCKAGNCKPCNEKDIKAIVSSQRGNGALYYKIKWQDNSTDWYFPCKIPGNLIREYHANGTMSGKKRKKPLHDKQHKFFTESQPNVHTVQSGSTKTESVREQNANVNPHRSRLMGMKLINDKPYYWIQKGTAAPEWQTVTMAHWLVRDLLEFLINDRNKEDQELRISHLKDRQQGYIRYHRPELYDPHCSHVTEIQETEDGNYLFLITYRNQELPPEWMPIHNVAPGCKHTLIRTLKYDYHKVVKKNQAY